MNHDKKAVCLPGSPSVVQLEERILGVKRDLSSISDERWQAALGQDNERVLTARKKAAEKMLENCNALAQYVSYTCPNIGRDLSNQETKVRMGLEEIRRTNNPDELHKWYKENLIPFVKHSEALAHVAATSRKKQKKADAECHRWLLQRKRSSRKTT